jgi:hypothetical protein
MATTETVEEGYSSAAREAAVSEAGHRAAAGVSLKASLLDIDITKVCGFLKAQAMLVIDEALAFDGRHAEARMVEIGANPDREVPNPYSAESQEVLKTIVRAVLSSSLDALRPLMCLGWEESTWPAAHLAAAERAVMKQIDEDYPRRRVDFENQAKARRLAAVRPLPPGNEPAAPTRKTGKRKAPPSGRGKKPLLVAALSRHHGYDDGHCSNCDPIGSNELARQAGVGKRAASEFFKREFKGHAAYVATCGLPHRLGQGLKALNGDLRPRELHTEYRDERSGVPLFRQTNGTLAGEAVGDNCL